MIVYETPLNERVRLLLRLEHLAERFNALAARGDALDHHFALKTLFEIVELCDSRSDLKSEVLKELESYRQSTLSYRGKEGVNDAYIDQWLTKIQHCYADLNGQMGKISNEFNNNEWLTSVSGRMNMLAGTCSFDHPSYHAWLHAEPQKRRDDLLQWVRPLSPIFAGIRLVLRLVRDTAVAQKVMAENGVYQQSWSPSKSYQLLMVTVAPNLQLIPVTSANRLMATIRMMRHQDDKLVPAGNVQVGFELALCT